MVPGRAASRHFGRTGRRKQRKQTKQAAPAKPLPEKKPQAAVKPEAAKAAKPSPGEWVPFRKPTAPSAAAKGKAHVGGRRAPVPVPDSGDDEDDVSLPPLPAGSRNYMTPQGYARMKNELTQLLNVERPELVKVVSWAASNGDRSENGDYLYGKRRLREIDRRIRFLMKRLENAEVVDPRDADHDQVFFGATVTYADSKGEEHTVSIVGLDEVDPARGRISWVSPVARALMKSRTSPSFWHRHGPPT